MKIRFKIANFSSDALANKMLRAIRTEGEGIDPGPMGWNADLRITGNLFSWGTATSGFRYHVHPDGDGAFCGYASTDGEILYEGSFNGFLSQELLPREWRENKSNVEILWAYGTYGEFWGSDALAQYTAARDKDKTEEDRKFRFLTAGVEDDSDRRKIKENLIDKSFAWENYFAGSPAWDDFGFDTAVSRLGSESCCDWHTQQKLLEQFAEPYDKEWADREYEEALAGVKARVRHPVTGANIPIEEVGDGEIPQVFRPED